MNQTQSEIQKAIDAANRAEKSSQTPAPVKIYPATNEKLGGVKVNGKTIIASKDETISALESKNLKNEITNIKLTQNAILGLSVKISHPNNF